MSTVLHAFLLFAHFAGKTNFLCLLWQIIKKSDARLTINGHKKKQGRQAHYLPLRITTISLVAIAQMVFHLTALELLQPASVIIPNTVELRYNRVYVITESVLSKFYCRKKFE